MDQHVSPPKTRMTPEQQATCKTFLAAIEHAADDVLDATDLGDPERIFAGDVLMYVRKQFAKWVAR